MSCETLAAKTWDDPKDPSTSDQYLVDFNDHLARRWASTIKERSLGLFIRATVENGYDYECTTPGRSGAKEPLWPKTVAATVQDGSAIWTCRAPSTSSLETTITGTPTWTCSDAAIVISSIAVSGQSTTAFLAGGADGQDYTVIVTATCANSAVKALPCILQVRRAVRVCPE